MKVKKIVKIRWNVIRNTGKTEIKEKRTTNQQPSTKATWE